jgi:hypothetical protein
MSLGILKQNPGFSGAAEAIAAIGMIEEAARLMDGYVNLDALIRECEKVLNPPPDDGFKWLDGEPTPLEAFRTNDRAQRIKSLAEAARGFITAYKENCSWCGTPRSCEHCKQYPDAEPGDKQPAKCPKCGRNCKARLFTPDRR